MKYRVVNGINVGDRRAEPGDVVELTAGQADALEGSVEKVTEPRVAKKVAGGSDVPRR